MKMNVRPIISPARPFLIRLGRHTQDTKRRRRRSFSLFPFFFLVSSFSSLYEKVVSFTNGTRDFPPLQVEKDLKWRPSSTTKKGKRFMSCIIINNINKSPSSPPPPRPFSFFFYPPCWNIYTSEMHPFSWISCLTAHTIQILARISL